MRNDQRDHDGCGCIAAIVVIIFLIVTLAMMPTLFDSFEQKYIY